MSLSTLLYSLALAILLAIRETNKSRAAIEKNKTTTQTPTEPFVYYYNQIEMWICVRIFFVGVSWMCVFFRLLVVAVVARFRFVFIWFIYFNNPMSTNQQDIKYISWFCALLSRSLSRSRSHSFFFTLNAIYFKLAACYYCSHSFPCIRLTCTNCWWQWSQRTC